MSEWWKSELSEFDCGMMMDNTRQFFGQKCFVVERGRKRIRNLSC